MSRKHWKIGCKDALISMPSSNTPLVVFSPHSESTLLTPRRCWRSLGPPFRDLGARLNNKNLNGVLGECYERSVFLIGLSKMTPKLFLFI